MKKDTKIIVFICITVLLLIVCIVGVTYAFFEANLGSGASTNVNAKASTTDSLKFSVGKNLSISANQDNFSQGKGNLSDTTTAKAELLANNKTNSATYNYYVYLEIENNDFVYTTSDNKAELLIEITKPDGTVLNTLNGLNYVTSGGVSGFDVTTKSGLITLAENYEIKAENSTSTITQEWSVKLTFVNLDTDQILNAGKDFSAKILIQQNSMADSLADVCGTNENMASCVKKLYSESNSAVSNLYLHDASLANGANDGSYRYSGADPKNYVCFGSTEETCPADNLYRIIGVFGDQVKLIKYDYITAETLGMTAASNNAPNATYYKGNMTSIPSFYWSGSSSNQDNTWSRSTLNISALNGTYLTKLGTTWGDKITEATWFVGGMPSDQRKNKTSIVYDYELGASKIFKTHKAKVGLVYVSEYGYAASPENWTISLYDYNNDINRNNNWMYMGATEWTITEVSNRSYYAFFVSDDGHVDYYGVADGYGLRPSFNLTSDVRIGGGLGTKENPYRIVL